MEAGESKESFRVFAGVQAMRRYLLDGDECVTWDCFVADGYTIDFVAKVSSERAKSEVQCVGRKLNLVGVDSSRVLCENQRRSAFRGHLDLGGEHAECMTSGSAGLVLTLELDNRFSYFAAKDIELRIVKMVPVGSRKVTGDPEDKVPMADSPPAQAAVASPINGSPREAGGQAEASPPRLSGCYRFAQYASEVGDLAGGGGTGGSGGEGDRSSRLRVLVAEAVRLCPPDAAALRGHLRAAQACLAEYEKSTAEEDSALG